MRTLVVLVVALLVALALAVPSSLASSGRRGVGLEVRFDIEAALTSTKQVSSDRVLRAIGVWIPLLGFLFQGPPTEVFEHSKGLSGTFLGEPVSGELKVVEVRRGQSDYYPALMRLEARGSSLVLAFGSPTERGYRVWGLPDKSTGVFSALEVGGHVRVVGLPERFSIIRGEIVIGWANPETALSALVSAGWAEETARTTLAQSRIRVVPFPQVDRGNPPARTEVRWVSSAAGASGREVSVAVLIGTDAMPPAEGGGKARSTRVRVIATHTSGTVNLFDGEAGPGDQVVAVGRVVPPGVLMVLAGSKLLFQTAITVED